MLTIYCLCAAWCRTCDAYAAVEDSLRSHRSGRLQWVWVDIEDHADAIADVDIETFPTLLIADAQAVYFFGPVLPQPAVTARLIDQVLAGKLPTLEDRQILALKDRLVQK